MNVHEYHAFLAARLVALLSSAAALFAGAWILVRELGRAALLGAFVAITPMAVFTASSVTASGLEIASGFAVGAIVVVCLRKPQALLAPRTHLLLAGVGSVLVLSRQMGVVTLAVLLAVLAAVASRQVCTVKQSRTNTPLHALTLLNDVTYLEAARALAERAIKTGGATPAERITTIYRLTISRRPSDAELAVLTARLEQLRAAYSQNKEAAAKLIKVGESQVDTSLDASELAAYTGVANVVLNLDETLTKE